MIRFPKNYAFFLAKVVHGVLYFLCLVQSHVKHHNQLASTNMCPFLFDCIFCLSTILSGWYEYPALIFTIFFSLIFLIFYLKFKFDPVLA